VQNLLRLSMNNNMVEVTMADETHTIVAISRQMASGGSYIGYLLAKKLNFKYVDREILREAAKNMNTDESWLQHFDERSSGILSKILSGFSLGAPETATITPLHPPIYDKDLYTVECKIMNQIVDSCHAVIMGRGGFYALRERPKMLRVFIHAPMEFRVKRFMKFQNINEQEARTVLEDSDRKKAKFVRDMVHVNWTDSRNFHLCIDSSVIDFNSSVDLILRFVNKLSAP
jgi:uncharacterized protein